eukprot:m.478799 g.478799  ORF g.478799 m.478799 type:complete len:119 (-) comp21695_c1_seq8:1006-1362(-)
MVPNSQSEISAKNLEVESATITTPRIRWCEQHWKSTTTRQSHTQRDSNARDSMQIDAQKFRENCTLVGNGSDFRVIFLSARSSTYAAVNFTTDRLHRQSWQCPHQYRLLYVPYYWHAS